MIDKLNKCKFLRDSWVEYKVALAYLLLLLKPPFLFGRRESVRSFELPFVQLGCGRAFLLCTRLVPDFSSVHAIYYCLGRKHQSLI